MTRAKVVEIIRFADIDDVPPGVELCTSDRCDEDEGIHAAHPLRDLRGALVKTYTCKDCRRTVARGLSCPCRKEPIP